MFAFRFQHDHDVADHFGRRPLPRLSAAAIAIRRCSSQINEYFAEAADYVEVLRRLWDSWEDDAEIRDVATGRFIDRDKLHYIDFDGRWFSVKGPSITPRPPQGQPSSPRWATAAPPTSSSPQAPMWDSLPRTTPPQAADIAVEIGALQRAVGRSEDAVHIFGDLVVFLDDDATAAQARRHRLDDLAGTEYHSDAEIFVGTSGRAGRPAAGVACRRAYPVSGCGRPRCRMTSSRSPRPGARVAAPGGVPHRL